ncbi:PE-PGRS family protein, partial [Actinomadura logoneensis]
AAGRRFRIVRVEQLVRSGPDGPEPPRPSDLDPRPSPRRAAPRPYELLDDGRLPPGLAASELLCQLLDAAAHAGAEPASEAFLTPLPMNPAFAVAERTAGSWRPTGRLHDSPRAARDSLALYFRHVVPAVEEPAEADRAEYAAAADLMTDGTRRNGIQVAGRRFRIVRIERITLMGPDGPEPPRPTDLDIL